ncbi:PH domain-containing protein [Shewanella donghaensis]|uniref:PH domain-containing protein n=1 Tax=Shewanella donghaensis TaxID=238836 RepID=UPI001182E520|nr:PH domain-containing protein [Shewanella donghaensis]
MSVTPEPTATESVPPKIIIADADVTTSNKTLIAESVWQSYTEVELTLVDKNYPKQVLVQNISMLIIAIIALVVVMTLNEALGSNEYAVITAILAVGTNLTLIRFFAAKKLCYGILEHEILIRRGLWWIKTTALPYSRLQHVSLSQNPLQRRFKLATLKCFSAGSGSAEIFLPGLNFKTAEQLRQHLLNRASSHQQTSANDQGIIDTAEAIDE